MRKNLFGKRVTHSQTTFVDGYAIDYGIRARQVDIFKDTGRVGDLLGALLPNDVPHTFLKTTASPG